MGRVRKYKKIKSCDPFAKRGPSSDGDAVHDEPPELFDQRVKNSKKRKQYDWDDEEQREILLQREAARNIKQAEAKATKKEAVKIEGQREGESLRDFKKRVREGTKKTLSEELQKMTATSKKKKEYLKERKIKKKLAKNGGADAYREDVIEFSAAANGHMRPSDLGISSTSFAQRETLGFGERVEQPPDLKQFAPRLEQRKLKSQAQAEARVKKPRGGQYAPDGRSDQSSAEESEEEEEEVLTESKRRRLNKQKQRIQDRLDMEGDDGLESVLVSRGREGIIHAGSHRLAAPSTTATEGGAVSKKRVPSSASTKNANFAEMEKIRNRVQDAYKLLRDKRRAQSGVVFNSSNRF